MGQRSDSGQNKPTPCKGGANDQGAAQNQKSEIIHILSRNLRPRSSTSELYRCWHGEKMKIPKAFTLLLVVFAAMWAHHSASGQAVVKGKVTAAGSGETLPGATILVEELNLGALSEPDGSYELSLPPGNHLVEVRFVGFEAFAKRISLKADERLNLNVQLEPLTLKAIEVSSRRADLTESAQLGKENLDMATIELLPAFLGEVDLLKSLQLLPGVQASGEGNAGFFVRGGGPDQNLILFDGAPVYNAAHLLGFFSVFNGDAVEDVELYKGGMPAKYGERLASVIDVRQRSGSNEDYAARGGIGLISSRASIEGPIKKGKSSFIFSGRRTYIDVLIRPFLNEDAPFGGSQYFFYDLNGRLDFELNDGSKLFVSGYLGDDVFGFDSPQTEFNTDVDWGNRILTAGWKKRIGNDALLSLQGTFTNYAFGFRGGQDEFELQVRSDIRDYRLQPDITFYLGGHRINTGLLYVFHDISPNNSSAVQAETVFDLGQQQQFYSHEKTIWISDEYDLNERWRVEAGIRFSGFTHAGPFDRFLLDSEGRTRDTVSYGGGERVAQYFGWEPRLQVRYKLNPQSALKASFTQNYQYIHLANLSPLALPTDVWLPSTDIVAPQLGKQWSAGYFREFLEGDLEASAEVYYKDMRNLVEYKENTQPQDGVGNNEDNFLTFGRAYAAGLELYLRKVKGRTTGWVAYTLSRTERQFDEINQGRWYPAPFDRRHDLAVVAAHEFNDRWTVGANFVYGTGRPITLPESGYFIENRLTLEYADRNSFRMIDYHRLDLSATYHTKSSRELRSVADPDAPTPKRKLRSKWVFSIYNVYSRLNPYFYYFDNAGRPEENSFQITARQVSLFPILPSVTWNFEF